MLIFRIAFPILFITVAATSPNRETYFGQSIRIGRTILGDLQQPATSILTLGQNLFSKKTGLFAFYQFNYQESVTTYVGLKFTIEFTSLASSFLPVCVLGPNVTPYLTNKNQNVGDFISINSFIDTLSFNRGDQSCTFILNFQKIRKIVPQIVNGLNQINLSVFLLDSSADSQLKVQIDEILKDQFDCPNQCNFPNGDCKNEIGDCWCRNGFGGIDCSQKLTLISKIDSWNPFYQTLSNSPTSLKYFSFLLTEQKLVRLETYFTQYTITNLECVLDFYKPEGFQYLPSFDNYLASFMITYSEIQNSNQFSINDTGVSDAYESNLSPSLTIGYKKLIVGCYSSLTSGNNVAGYIYFKPSQTLPSSAEQTSNSSSSSLIIGGVIIGIVIILFLIILACSKSQWFQNRRHPQNLALMTLEQLQRNNPRIEGAQNSLNQNLLTQNEIIQRITANVVNRNGNRVDPQCSKDQLEKQYMEDIEKCFPLMTLQQIHEYLREEAPNLKPEDYSKECSICYCDFNFQSIRSNEQNKQGDLRLFSFCNHFFHVSCIHDWLKKDKSCPHCRFQISQALLNKVKDQIEDVSIGRTKRLIEKMKKANTGLIIQQQTTLNDQNKSDKEQEGQGLLTQVISPQMIIEEEQKDNQNQTSSLKRLQNNKSLEIIQEKSEDSFKGNNKEGEIQQGNQLTFQITEDKMEVIDTIEDEIFKLKIKTLEDSVLGTQIEFPIGEEAAGSNNQAIVFMQMHDDSQNQTIRECLESLSDNNNFKNNNTLIYSSLKSNFNYQPTHLRLQQKQKKVSDSEIIIELRDMKISNNEFI